MASHVTLEWNAEHCSANLRARNQTTQSDALRSVTCLDSSSPRARHSKQPTTKRSGHFSASAVRREISVANESKIVKAPWERHIRGFVFGRCRLYEAQEFFASGIYKYAAPTALVLRMPPGQSWR
jgi:hypothetical protein